MTFPPPAFHAANFRDDVLYGIADLLALDRDNLDPAALRRWTSSVNRHLGLAWNLYPFPETFITEERAFRQIWNIATAYAVGAEVFEVTAQGYYRKIGTGGVGTLVGDVANWEPFCLCPSDYYIPLLQPGRRRIGQVQEVYATNPDTIANCSQRALNWQVTERGLEIRGGVAGGTVFVHYKQQPPRFTSTPYSSLVTYTAGTVTFYADPAVYEGGGQVYRATQTVAMVTPGGTGGEWVLVPFPRLLVDHVVLMAAADEADDLQTAQTWRGMGEDMLNQADDQRIMQTGGFSRWQLTRPNRRWSLDCCEVVLLTVTGGCC